MPLLWNLRKDNNFSFLIYLVLWEISAKSLLIFNNWAKEEKNTQTVTHWLIWRCVNASYLVCMACVREFENPSLTSASFSYAMHLILSPFSRSSCLRILKFVIADHWITGKNLFAKERNVFGRKCLVSILLKFKGKKVHFFTVDPEWSRGFSIDEASQFL